MPITLNHVYIYYNPSSHRQRKHTSSKYIKISINSTYRLQKNKQMITKICNKSYWKGKFVECNIFQQQNLRRNRRELIRFISSTVDEVVLVGTGSWSHEAQQVGIRNRIQYTSSYLQRLFPVWCCELSLWLCMYRWMMHMCVFKCNFKLHSAQKNCPAFSACASWKEEKITVNRRASGQLHIQAPYKRTFFPQLTIFLYGLLLTWQRLHLLLPSQGRQTLLLLRWRSPWNRTWKHLKITSHST